MSTRSLITTSILTFALLTACGGATIHINREYRMPAARESVLALFPTDFHRQTTDDAFQSSFTKFATFKQVLSPGDVRLRQRIGSQVHAALRNDDDAAPLKLVLSDSQYSYLVSSLAPANLVFFPLEITFTESGPNTYATFSYRLYDLKSGILLAKSGFELRTSGRGIKTEAALVTEATDRMAREVMAVLASR